MNSLLSFRIPLIRLSVIGLFFSGCTTAYKMNLHILPEDTYSVYINDTLKTTTSPAGKATVSTGQVPLNSEPMVVVKKDSLYGRIQLRSNDKPSNQMNVSSFKNKSSEYDHVYDIEFSLKKKSESKVALEIPKPADLKSMVDLPAIYREAPAEKKPAIENQPSKQVSTSSSLDQAEDTLTSMGPILKKPDTVLGTVIGQNAENAGLKTVTTGLSKAKKSTVNGATAYFIGVGLDYLVITPLAFNLKSNDVGGAILLLALGAVTSALKISGATVSNVGASSVNDIAMQEYDLPSTHSNHWGFYQGGWACIAGSSVLNMIGAVSTISSSDSVKKADPGYAIAGLALGLGADILWSISCIRSVMYANDVIKKTEKSRLSLEPQFDPKGNAGLKIGYRF